MVLVFVGACILDGSCHGEKGECNIEYFRLYLLHAVVKR